MTLFFLDVTDPQLAVYLECFTLELYFRNCTISLEQHNQPVNLSTRHLASQSPYQYGIFFPRRRLQLDWSNSIPLRYQKIKARAPVWFSSPKYTTKQTFPIHGLPTIRINKGSRHLDRSNTSWIPNLRILPQVYIPETLDTRHRRAHSEPVPTWFEKKSICQIFRQPAHSSFVWITASKQNVSQLFWLLGGTIYAALPLRWSSVWQLSSTSPKMIDSTISTSICNMGRGAYDTTGVPRPKPEPKPK